MLSCVFWQHIPLEIEFPSRGFYSYAQWYDPWAVRQLLTRGKKTETGQIYNSAMLYGQVE